MWLAEKIQSNVILRAVGANKLGTDKEKNKIFKTKEILPIKQFLAFRQNERKAGCVITAKEEITDI